MSVLTVETERDRTIITPAPRAIDVALLGFGCIGSAVARLAARSPQQIRLIGALVRHPERPRADAPAAPFELTSDHDALLARRPDVVVEVLGRLEPARTIVRDALSRGIAVVTANKSLMAAHGDELLEIAAHSGTPLLYEASVIAGVPFLGAFASRRHASAVTHLTGIVNGTSNFILSTMASSRVDCAIALAEAQRLGYAEPDPGNDVGGIDAAEKLAVLLRHFGFGNVAAGDVETVGIERLGAIDFTLAHNLGGALKPIVSATRTASGVDAFVGPAFVPATHRLARVGGVENAIVIRNDYGELLYSGPGAGPAPTAATILDDVIDAAATAAASPRPRHVDRAPAIVASPETGWYIRLAGLPSHDNQAIGERLGTCGVRLQQSSDLASQPGVFGALTCPCSRARIEQALAAAAQAWRCETFAVRAI